MSFTFGYLIVPLKSPDNFVDSVGIGEKDKGLCDFDGTPL